MKKFLVTLVVILIAVSLGFGVFFLVRDNEVIAIKSTSLYKDANQTFEIALDIENAKSYTKVSVYSSDENVVKVKASNIDMSKGVASATFEAKAGGNARVVFKTDNAKFRNIYCDVVVGDGSKAYPYRITTASQLQSLGTEQYALDKHYIMYNDIDLGALSEDFTPIGNFSGSFNGNGYTISNLTVENLENVGLFTKIEKGAVVENVKFENATITAGSTTNSAGVVTAVNQGTISRVEVKNAIINCSNDVTVVGAIAGVNNSINEYSVRGVARIDRCSANVTFGSEENKIRGIVGGIVSKNIGGVVINCYTTGELYSSVNKFGGVVALNNALSITGDSANALYQGVLGANVKDCYSIINLTNADASKMGYIIAVNNDILNNGQISNRVVGNHYLTHDTVKGFIGSDYEYGYNETNQPGTLAVSAEALKNVATLKSYTYYDKIITVNSSNEIVVDYDKTTERTFYWNTAVWKVDGTINNGFPYLNYESQIVDDNFDNTGEGEVIMNVEDLKGITSNLGGTYYLGANIQLAENWAPIGTSETPFTGQFIALDNYVISGLSVSGVNVAGLFGTIGEGALVKGVKLSAPNTNGTVTAGTIAGVNNGKVVNCEVIDAVVKATENSGAVVGVNNGLINNAVVNGANSSTITVTKGYVGGLAGINFGEIVNTNGMNAVIGKVKIISEDASDMGGAVGYNGGLITRVKVNIDKTNSYGITSSAVVSAGGVAGYSDGYIDSCYVSVNISANTEDENTYVGGIVGQLYANYYNAVTNAVVTSSNIMGYNAGGIAGYMTTNYAVELEVDKKGLFEQFYDVFYVSNEFEGSDIHSFQVDNSVNMFGTYTAGVVVNITKGVISNGYTKAVLNGSNNAGIAYTISYNKDEKTGGAIYSVYSMVTATAGTTYAVSASEVHQTWALSSAKDRSVGFVYNYNYLEQDNMNDPKMSGPFAQSYALGEADMISKINELNLDDCNLLRQN